MVVKLSLRRRLAPTVGNGAFSHKIDCNFKKILNPEGHQIRITGSRVTAILLKKVNFSYWTKW